MQEIIPFEPLKGQEAPCRVRVVPENGKQKAYLQTTGYLDPADLCIGRAVEELPRILSIRSPAHHLAAARLLDRLFGVEPPGIAENMRDALGQSLVLCHHLRKLHLLLLDPKDPFPDHRASAKPAGRRAAVAHRRAETVMHTLGLAQEAAAILGGRSDHPLTAIAGGVSRFLKDGYYQRLTEIADACLDLVLKIDAFFREDLLNDGGPLHPLSEVEIDPIPTATVVEGKIVLRDRSGAIVDDFPPEKTPEKISVRGEPWSYLPFAALTNGTAGPETGGPVPGIFLVGPLARMAGGDPLPTSEAEAARQRMDEELGSSGKWTPAAACRALLVDLIGTAERMTDLYKKENFVGPAIRTVPEKMGAEAWAALEGPAGLIVLGATVDGKGIVESIQVVDPVQINNGVRCRIAEAAVAEGLSLNRSHTDTKRRLENSLLPF